MKKCLIYVLIAAFAFWVGWICAPTKTKIVQGEERIIYKLTDIPEDVFATYLSLTGKELVNKDAAQQLRNERHLVWQEGYIEGIKAAGKQ